MLHCWQRRWAPTQSALTDSVVVLSCCNGCHSVQWLQWYISGATCSNAHLQVGVAATWNPTDNAFWIVNSRKPKNKTNESRILLILKPNSIQSPIWSALCPATAHATPTHPIQRLNLDFCSSILITPGALYMRWWLDSDAMCCCRNTPWQNSPKIRFGICWVNLIHI
jgi:hypothetical protein